MVNSVAASRASGVERFSSAIFSRMQMCTEVVRVSSKNKWPVDEFITLLSNTSSSIMHSKSERWYVLELSEVYNQMNE